MSVLIADSQLRKLFVEGEPGEISIEDARRRWEANEFDNWTLSAANLARCGWDWDVLHAHYEEMDKWRGIARAT